MKQTINSQVEKILDETSGAYTDVIIQFKSEKDHELSKLLEVAVETERNRAMMVDPRHVLPPNASAFKSKTPTARRKLRSQNTSLVANIALQAVVGQLPGADLFQLANQFLGSTEVQSAMDGVRKRLKGKAGLAKEHHLQNIGGVRLMVNKGDLRNVVDAAEGSVAGVFENAIIKTPRISEASANPTSQSNYQGTTWGIEHTKALATWSAFNTRGKMENGEPVRVAVLDTGIDATHPDLAGKVVDFAEFDGSGNIIAQGPAAARDSGRHGTHVAGTIVGGNASGGWIGMAPEAEVIGGLVLNGDQGGTLAQVIAGIDWAVSNEAQVINLSLGGLTFESSVGTPYQRAIVDALVRGSLVVAAIGNEGHQTTGAPGNDYFSLAVGAHDVNGRCAGFSGGRTLALERSDYIDAQYLPLVYTKPDISGPGVDVRSCVPGGEWDSFNGTSMATPHAAGAAALLFAATTISEVERSQRGFLARDLLIGGVTDMGEAGQDQRFGYGAINSLKSIDEAKSRGF